MHSEVVLNLGQRLIEHAVEIGEYFTVPVQVSIIVRMPGNDKADVLLTNDDVEEIRKVLDRSAGNRVVSEPEIYGQEKSNGKAQEPPPAA